MKFIKDLIIFELQTTGTETEKDNIIQLSAIVLDKDNLLEKNVFNSYVRISMLEGTIAQHAEALGIPYETMRKSPKIYDVVKQFHAQLGTDGLLCTHTISNVMFLKTAFKKAGVPFDYDRHVVDLWTLGYIYTLNYGIKKMPTFNTFLDYFRLKQTNRYNALERARLAGEIFRKIIKDT